LVQFAVNFFRGELTPQNKVAKIYFVLEIVNKDLKHENEKRQRQRVASNVVDVDVP